MKRILAAATLFLPAALAATDTIFGTIPDPCGPCLHRVVANGPGSVESKEFANYICIGEGGGEIAVCVTECGATSTVGDVMASSYVEAQLYLIIGLLFGIAVKPLIHVNSVIYYPKETCQADKGVFGNQLDKVCAAFVTGGSSNSKSSVRSTSRGSSTATISSPVTRTTDTAATGTTATGTAATGTTAKGTAAAGTAAAGTAATGTNRPTQTPSSAAAASALSSWKMLIGLVMLTCRHSRFKPGSWPSSPQV